MRAIIATLLLAMAASSQSFKDYYYWQNQACADVGPCVLAWQSRGLQSGAGNGVTVAIVPARGRPNLPLYVMVGATRARIAVGSCYLLIDPAQFFLLLPMGPVESSGHAIQRMPLPWVVPPFKVHVMAVAVDWAARVAYVSHGLTIEY